MELKHLENIDKCCIDFNDCEGCPFYTARYKKRSSKELVINNLCKIAYYNIRKPLREIIEEIKSIELPPKEKMR